MQAHRSEGKVFFLGDDDNVVVAVAATPNRTVLTDLFSSLFSSLTQILLRANQGTAIVFVDIWSTNL